MKSWRGREVWKGRKTERERRRRKPALTSSLLFFPLSLFPLPLLPSPLNPPPPQSNKNLTRLILALTSNWGDVGSLTDFVGKAGGSGGRDPALVFFTEPAPRKLYLQHAAALANRINSITGVRYGDDPTIFALVRFGSEYREREMSFSFPRPRPRPFFLSPFSLLSLSLLSLPPSLKIMPDTDQNDKKTKNLINEPRCRGCGTAIGDWASAVAPLVRKEWRQLLTVGAEGFYSDSLDPQRAGANPGGRGSWAGSEGQSFLRDHAAMDFLSIHSEGRGEEGEREMFRFPPPRLLWLPLLLLSSHLLRPLSSPRFRFLPANQQCGRTTGNSPISPS